MLKTIAAQAGALAIGLLALSPAAASADSCWDHNGSLMRLKAAGNERAFYYERPKQGMRDAGVTRGTREVMERCQPTGRSTTDTLVFTYSHQC